MDVLAPVTIGVLFGWLLDRGRLTRPEVVSGVYRFTDLTVMKFLGAALVAGIFVVHAALALHIVDSVPTTPTMPLRQAIGGALLGAGMAAAGFCPGTIVAGAGGGRVDALLPGLFGLLAGALLHAAWVTS